LKGSVNVNLGIEMQGREINPEGSQGINQQPRLPTKLTQYFKSMWLGWENRERKSRYERGQRLCY
jgi:hypothetical protein